MLTELKANKIYEGDCLEIMRQFPDNCIDTILTDPPYGLLFMGKNWDHGIPGIPYWQECLRIGKPGSTLMAFGGTRTYHRLACAIEDAGWQIRDCITYFHDASQQELAFMASLNEEQLAAYLELHYPNMQLAWVYGSGFPKSLDISKSLDDSVIVDCVNCNGEGWILPMGEDYVRRIAEVEDIPLETAIIAYQEKCSQCGGIGKVKGMEREVVGDVIRLGDKKAYPINPSAKNHSSYCPGNGDGPYKDKGKVTAPASPIAKKWDGWKSHGLKPAYEPIILAMKPNEGSYADNARKWGVSGLWIDGGRIETGEGLARNRNGKNNLFNGLGKQELDESNNTKGRYPSNLIHDNSETVEAVFAKAGVRKTGGKIRHKDSPPGIFGLGGIKGDIIGFNDTSYSASRYFAKCPPDRFYYHPKAPPSERATPGNNHPAQKPLSLMRELAKLTKTPDGGIVLDPFAGSGTTALACIAEGRDYILIEKEPEYCDLIKRRIAEYTGQEVQEKKVTLETETVKQLGLW